MSDTTDVGQLFYIMFDVVIFAFAVTVLLTTHQLLIRNTYRVAALERVNTTISEIDDSKKKAGYVNGLNRKEGYNAYRQSDSRYRTAADQYDGTVDGSALFSEIESLPEEYECTIENNPAAVNKGERPWNLRTKEGRKKIQDRIDTTKTYVRAYKVDTDGSILGVNYFIAT
jgi:hypothetical protein